MVVWGAMFPGRREAFPRWIAANPAIIFGLEGSGDGRKSTGNGRFRRWVIALGAGHPVVGFLAGNYDKRRCDSGGGSVGSVSCCATLLGSAGSPWSGFIAKIS